MIDHIRKMLQRTPAFPARELRRVFAACAAACSSSGAPTYVRRDGTSQLLLCAAELTFGCPMVSSILAEVATDQLDHTLRRARVPTRPDNDRLLDASDNCICKFVSTVSVAPPSTQATKKAAKHIRRLQRLISQLEEQWTESARKRRKRDPVRDMFDTEDVQLAATPAAQTATAVSGVVTMSGEYCVVSQLLHGCRHANASMCGAAHQQLSQSSAKHSSRLAEAARHASCAPRLLRMSQSGGGMLTPSTSSFDVACLSILQQFGRCAVRGAAHAHRSTLMRLLEEVHEAITDHSMEETAMSEHGNGSGRDRRGISPAALATVLWLMVVPQALPHVVHHAVRVYRETTSLLLRPALLQNPDGQTGHTAAHVASVLKASEWLCTLFTLFGHAISIHEFQPHLCTCLERLREMCEHVLSHTAWSVAVGRQIRSLLEVLAVRAVQAKGDELERKVEELLTSLAHRQDMQFEVPTRLLVFVCVFACPSAAHVLELFASRLAVEAADAGEAAANVVHKEQPSFLARMAELAPVTASYLQSHLQPSSSGGGAGSGKSQHVAYGCFTDANAVALLRERVRHRSNSDQSWESFCDWEDESEGDDEHSPWSRRASLRTIPESIYVHILSYMSFKRVAKCSFVNRAFYQAANYPGLWEDLYKHRFPVSFEHECFHKKQRSAFVAELANVIASQQQALEAAPALSECVTQLSNARSSREFAALLGRLYEACQTKPCTKCSCMKPRRKTGITTCTPLLPARSHNWQTLFKVRRWDNMNHVLLFLTSQLCVIVPSMRCDYSGSRDRGAHSADPIEHRQRRPARV